MKHPQSIDKSTFSNQFKNMRQPDTLMENIKKQEQNSDYSNGSKEDLKIQN